MFVGYINVFIKVWGTEGRGTNIGQKNLLLPLVNEVIIKTQCWTPGTPSNMKIYFLHTQLHSL